MLKIQKNEDLDKKSEWHMVPANLNVTEPIQNAKVRNYFTTSIKHQPELTAALQGHALFGQHYDEPDLYKCISYRSNQGKDSVEIVMNERVGSIVDWRKDTHWQPFQGHIGSLRKFIVVQKALHQ